MADNARKEILARVRHASRGASAEQIAAELDALGEGASAPLPDGDLAVSFLCNVLRNQGSADTAGDRSQAVKAIAAYLYERYRSHKLVAGNDPRLAALPWRDAGLLPRFGAVENGEPVGLSYARLGVAETGSIVTFTGRANPASNNLLPEDHVVLLELGDLVADLDQAWERINAEMAASGRPRGVNFISGPSSTADIALQLVRGAHGPRHWHVILVGDVPEGALETARSLAGFAPP